MPLSPDKAYRPSNIVPVRHGAALPLAAPKTPGFSSASVRLRSDNKKPAPDPDKPVPPTALIWLDRVLPYTASADLAWGVFDSRAIGVEIEEEHSASAIAVAPPATVRYLCRTRSDTDTPGLAIQPRQFEVPFPDVQIRASARAIDGWDRVSPASPPGSWTPLALQHAPYGPAIISADYLAGTVSLRFEDNWLADRIVLATSGVVEILRQTAAPSTLAVKLAKVGVVPESGGLLEATFAVPVPKPWEFAGGSFSIGTMVLSIAAITATSVQFTLPDADGGATFTQGTVTLKQSPHYAGLWSQVASLPVVQPFPADFGFTDVLPVDPKTAAPDICHACQLLARPARPPVGSAPGPGAACAARCSAAVRRDPIRSRLFPPHPSSASSWRNPTRPAASNSSSPTASTTLPTPSRRSNWARSPSPRSSPPARRPAGTDLIDIVNLPVLAHQEVDMTFALQRVDDSGAVSDFSAVVCPVPSLA
ncbi:MAG: hypothetical protein WDN06_01835 [Asticcacaulis sp.]